NDEEFSSLVQRSTSVRQVLMGMGLRPVGGNYLTVKRRMAALGLNSNHFLGKGHLKGKKCTWHPEISLDEILIKDSPYQGGTYGLKNRLLKLGLFEHKCYECGLREWRGRPIPLELEHKNGDRSDNRLENLTLLCPNCHAFTPTYRGKNKKPRW